MTRTLPSCRQPLETSDSAVGESSGDNQLLLVVPELQQRCGWKDFDADNASRVGFVLAAFSDPLAQNLIGAGLFVEQESAFVRHPLSGF